jgi:MinD superfamily P-loop ATPase
VRPAFQATCIFCGRCAAACPARALAFTPGARPVLDGRRCIACCCCHEVCPAHAIRMRRSPLLRLAGTFRELK